MLFQTWEFIRFFVVVLAGLYLLKPRFKALWLLLASYYFYASMSVVFLVFLVYVTLVDYLVGRRLTEVKKPSWRKSWITLSVLNGIFLLLFFKYADFVTENLQFIVSKMNWDYQVPTLAESATVLCRGLGIDYTFTKAILLPAGLSFFTFKSMSYTIDVYRGSQKTEFNLIRYAAYLAFFPALLSGPIDRAGLLLRQIRHKTVVRYVDISDGLSLFIIGLFKKVVLADSLAVFVDKVYDSPPEIAYSSWTIFLATFAYAWQLYGDFSGYTDMARGIARIMGFHLTLNFNNPYVATDVSDFWRRWHISLSTWFRDYVYIPLGGNRASAFRVNVNLFLTMLISGFWHGAVWTFAVWGAWHGILCVFYRSFEKKQWYLGLPKILKQILLFLLVALGWVFFRAKNMDTAVTLLKDFFTTAGTVSLLPWQLMVLPLGLWIYQLLFDSKYGKILGNRWVRCLTLAVLIVLILVVPSDANVKFLYFDF